MTPVLYRLSVHLLAIGPGGEFLNGQFVNTELTPAEYATCTAADLVERYTRPATYQAKHALDREARVGEDDHG